MKYRRLGRTGLKVSVIGVGTWQFGGEWGKDFSPDEAAAILGRAEELGINLIDTAECYGPEHLSESLIGGAIRGRRDRWVIATKFGHEFHGHLDRSDRRSAADVRRQLEGSLRALRTDYIDLYQYHSVRDSEFDDAEVRRVLEDALAAGKVRHLGNSISSNITNPHQVDGSTGARVGAIQVVYNRLDRRPEQQFFPSAVRQDLGVMARVPLASGYLSGKYKPGDTFGGGDVRAGHGPKKTAETLAEVQRIAREEVPAGVDMARWALAWCLRHPAVTCVIPGCKSVAQVEANAAAAGLDLVRDDHPQAVA